MMSPMQLLILFVVSFLFLLFLVSRFFKSPCPCCCCYWRFPCFSVFSCYSMCEREALRVPAGSGRCIPVAPQRVSFVSAYTCLCPCPRSQLGSGFFIILGPETIQSCNCLFLLINAVKLREKHRSGCRRFIHSAASHAVVIEHRQFRSDAWRKAKEHVDQMARRATHR